MGPTRKRDLTAAVVGAAVVGYLLVITLYRWFPHITVLTGLSLLAVAIAEALWARAPQLYMVILGALLILFVLKFPDGLVGWYATRTRAAAGGAP